MTTLKEIAYLSNASISTVSKVLNNASDVSDETAERIMQIVKEMGYLTPKERRIKKLTKKFIIAVIYPDARSNYYNKLLFILSEKIKALGGALISGCTNFDIAEELFLTQYFLDINSVDGILIVNDSENFCNNILKDKIIKPIVYISFNETPDLFDNVSMDCRGGINQAVECLHNLGHKEIGFLGEDLTDIKLISFRNAMSKFKLPINDDFIQISHFRFEEAGYDAMSKLIRQKNMPTAIISAYDCIAVGAMRASYEHEIKIPEELSIIGYNDVLTVSYLNEKLTTINCHIDEQIDISLDILLKKIENPSFQITQHIMIKTSLVIRETTAVPQKR